MFTLNVTVVQLGERHFRAMSFKMELLINLCFDFHEILRRHLKLQYMVFGAYKVFCSVYLNDSLLFENVCDRLEHSLSVCGQRITKTSPCNEDPLTFHFYSKTGVYRGMHFFLNFALKHG